MSVVIATLLLRKLIQERESYFTEKKQYERIKIVNEYLKRTFPIKSNYIVSDNGYYLEFERIHFSSGSGSVEFSNSKISLKHHLEIWNLQPECQLILNFAQKQMLLKLLE